MFRTLVQHAVMLWLIINCAIYITDAKLSNPPPNVERSAEKLSSEKKRDDQVAEVGSVDVAELQEKLRLLFANEKPYITDYERENVREDVEEVIRESNMRDQEFLGKARSNSDTKRNFRAYTGGSDTSFHGTQIDFSDVRKKEVEGDTREGSYGYLNEWVVHLRGGVHLAKEIFTSLGYEFHREVRGFRDLYRVGHADHPRLHKREAHELTQALNGHEQVVWAEQQQSKVREKRRWVDPPQEDSNRPLVRVKRSQGGEDKREDNTLVESSAETHQGTQFKAGDKLNLISARAERKQDPKLKILDRLLDHTRLALPVSFKGDLSDVFNDVLVDHQWYLYDSRVLSHLPRLDLGVVGAWRRGLTGEGVRVTVLDDGIDYTHDDLKDNFDPVISHDYNDDDEDPMPRQDPAFVNSHGTKCAGEVAMAANNGKCGVGVAYRARIGGVRMLDGHVSDRVEAESLSHARGVVDIVTASWGPMDDGKTVEGPGRLVQEALQKGVEMGRDGKGTIFVWAAGNGGLTSDNCNCDGYASSIFTTSITSASQSNTFPWYGEKCSSTLASAYSSGAYMDQKIVTTDVKNGCTSSFSGTSAAAPLAAGIVALALQANGNLTWRDVQHLTVLSSNYDPLSANDGWQQNALGFYFNLRFGFGLLDAEQFVTLAETWPGVPRKVSCDVNATTNRDGDWALFSRGSLRVLFEVRGCADAAPDAMFLEHVQVVLSLEHTRRGALQVDLKSPRGTETSLLTARPEDASSLGFRAWPFMSVHTWGEDPRGTWSLTIIDSLCDDSSGEGQNMFEKEMTRGFMMAS